MNILFKNYCIVALGEISGIIDIIKRVSENPPRKLQQTGVLICTFSSVMTVSELKEALNTKKRTFFIFEVGNDSAAYNIGRKDIHDQLFSHIENGGKDFLQTLSSNLMNNINYNADFSGDTSSKIIKDKEKDISNLTKSEMRKEIDKLLDKGYENLNSVEIVRLELLSKNM